VRLPGSSVTGGHVYSGTDFPALEGVYLCANYGSGRIWGLLGGADLGELVDTKLAIATIGQGNDGEVYVLYLFCGQIYKESVAQ